MIKFIIGDVFESDADVICHQVNCLGIMGGGIALTIRKKFPDVYVAYKNHCDGLGLEDMRSLLGTVLYVPTTTLKGKDLIIANVFAQLDIGCGVRTNYEAIEAGFRDIKKTYSGTNKTVAIPYGIGCGLAGGDWDRVIAIINDVFDDDSVDVTICKLPVVKRTAVFYE